MERLFGSPEGLALHLDAAEANLEMRKQIEQREKRLEEILRELTNANIPVHFLRLITLRKLMVRS